MLQKEERKKEKKRKKERKTVELILTRHMTRPSRTVLVGSLWSFLVALLNALELNFAYLHIMMYLWCEFSCVNVNVLM